jgi:serine protease Do
VVLACVLSALIGGSISALVALALRPDPVTVSAPSSSRPPIVVQQGGGPSQLAPGSLDIQALLDKARPSVVSIEVAGLGVGSGFVISDDGRVVTNAHVIGSANSMRVRLADGQRVGASLIGVAPDRDLALVQLEAGAYVPAELGDSDAIRVGDDVVAIGNALGLAGDPTVTRGVVSAKNRTIEEEDGVIIDGAIQTDAAINPGNSGGPLFNASGQVVGINTAIRGDSQNIGFAIAVATLVELLPDLEAADGGVVDVDRTFLGVETQDVSTVPSNVRSTYDIDVSEGAVVGGVTSGSGADDAGLEIGDVIVRLADAAIASSEELGQAIRTRAPGEVVDIEVLRSGQRLVLEATLGGR